MAVELNAGMIARTKASGSIRSAEVEAAFRSVLRHQFLPGVGPDLVYSGNSIVTHSDAVRGITSTSSDVAFMAQSLEALRLGRGLRVLEIGAGTGYNAALIDEVVGDGGHVTTIDNQPDVVDEAREHLAAAGRSRVSVVLGDGYDGWPANAPYDRITATASVRDVPLAWRDQLREGGLLEVSLRFGPGAQILGIFRRRGEAFESVAAIPGGAMPLRTDHEQLEQPLAVPPDYAFQLSRTEAGDADLLAALLSSEPTLELRGVYPGQAMFGLAGLVEADWVTMRPRGRNGMWQGVFDRASRGIAFIWPVVLPSGEQRANLIGYGSSAARTRLASLVTELAGIDFADVRIDAVPSGATAPVADVVNRQHNFTYAIRWRAAKGRAV